MPRLTSAQSKEEREGSCSFDLSAAESGLYQPDMKSRGGRSRRGINALHGGARHGPTAQRLPMDKHGVLNPAPEGREGAAVEEMMAATGWQAHSVRGTMSGALKKKLSLGIESETSAAGRVYRIRAEARR
jgi:hypothetical protein